MTRVPPNPNILYHNQGDGRFVKLTAESIIHGDVTSATGIWGDVDNDGDLDLFTLNQTNRSMRLSDDGEGNSRNRFYRLIQPDPL